MSTTALQALNRSGKVKKIRRDGFVPGVIYGENVEPKEVQFSFAELNKIIKDKGKTVRFKVKVGEKLTQCIIKDVQRDVVKGDVIHVDMQSITDHEVIKMKVPVVFTGTGLFESRGLLLENYLSEVELSGKVSSLPESIEINAEDVKFGDKLEVKDLNLPEGVEILNEKTDLVAVITASKVKIAES